MKENDVVRFDWAAKRLLRQKANFSVLEGFLTVLLKEDVTILEILESESNQEHKFDKYNRVDIKAKNSKGEIIIIEIQNTREIHYMERILYGVAKSITEYMNIGDSYSNIKKIYSVNILYFDLGIGNDYIYKGENSFVGVNTGDKLKINIKEQNTVRAAFPEEIFPEYYLIRVNEFNKAAISPLEEWIEFLKTGKIDKNASAQGLSEAREKLKYYAMTDAQKREYEHYLDNVAVQNDVISTSRYDGLMEGREEGLMEGRAEGLAEGRVEGRAEEKMRIVTNLLQMGLNIDSISSATGLSLEEISILSAKN